jgi:hypothetical protein
MIRNDEQLALVREQLGRLEAVLHGLEEEVRPKSEKWFELMSEIYVEHIDTLRREIAEYYAFQSGPQKTYDAIAQGEAERRPA